MKKKSTIIIVSLIGAAIVISLIVVLPLFNQNIGGTRYSHTIIIDGTNDFNANENFTTTSSPNYEGYMAWDQDYIYFGLYGDDFISSTSNKWVLIYIGNGSIGTTTGQAYTSQTPTLPFSATHHIRWRLDDTDLTAYEWTGSWTNALWDFIGDAYRDTSNKFFELRIPLVDIGSPSDVSVHISMIDEVAPWTYAGVPSTSFTDGIDPNYATYFQFDLDGTKTPTEYTPI